MSCAKAALAGLAIGVMLLAAKDSEVKQRIDSIRQLGRGDSENISKLAAYLNDPDPNIRYEAVKAIINIGTERSLDPLTRATADPNPDVDTLATDGIVNFYLPGYVPKGTVTRGVRGVQSLLKSRNDQIVPADLFVRDSVGQAIATEIAHAPDADTRANAARAAGILRLKQAVPALAQALRSRNSDLIVESLYALQKIHDPSAGPSVVFLVRDLENKVQMAALETVGALRTTEAATDLREVVANARNEKIRRAALEALAQLALPADRNLFRQYASASDTDERAAALEGLGRLREPDDFQMLQDAFNEQNVDWRVHLAAAFGMVAQGKTDTGDFSPLRYLVENLDQSGRADVAKAYVTELARREDVRKGLYALVPDMTPAQQVAFCDALAVAQAPDSVPVLTQLRSSQNTAVSMAAGRALRMVQARQS